MSESTRPLSELLPAVSRHLFALDSDHWMLAQEVQRATAQAIDVEESERAARLWRKFTTLLWWADDEDRSDHQWELMFDAAIAAREEQTP